ncbi:hypothetical protein M3175_01625 [Robertmurraya korlensis]|uniref:hypothetical protein n=1 Tax=Robertmurraya korlensis TaxID=519977 RepID=UPI00203C2D5B|nr:hypothetical protein [Robertmurraya korlensis]MCM3599415.1 hypothetical protein [Robertmurraya korlensis]
MLFTPTLLLAGGATIILAAIDKTCESYGFFWIGTFLKIALPLIGFAAGIYFIETNPLLEWLK